MIKRLKVLLFFPYMLVFFPLLIILGSEKTDAIGTWIIDID